MNGALPVALLAALTDEDVSAEFHFANALPINVDDSDDESRDIPREPFRSTSTSGWLRSP